MNPDGDPQLRESIEGWGTEPSVFPDPLDALDLLGPYEPLEPRKPVDPWDGFQPASPGSRPPSVASSYGSIASGVSHPPRAGNKRKKRVGITWSEFDGFSKDGDELKARKRARNEEPDAKRFACPFYKHNPQELKESETCAGPGWTSVHRVREHILRRHKYSLFQCHRCYGEFATETAVHDHQRANIPCEKKQVSNRITVQQEKQLRRFYRGSFDEEKRWSAIYKIVFPDSEVIPTPYYEPPDLPDYYRDLLMNRLPTLVKRQVDSHMTMTPLDPLRLKSIEAAVIAALKECLPAMGEAHEKENSEQTENQVALPSPPEPQQMDRSLKKSYP